MARYGRAASKSVERTMRKRKHGTLESGGSGKKVTSRKQPSRSASPKPERKAKVPRKRTTRSSSTRSTSSRRKKAA